MLCIMLVTLDISASVADFLQLALSFLYEFQLNLVHVSDIFVLPNNDHISGYELLCLPSSYVNLTVHILIQLYELVKH